MTADNSLRRFWFPSYVVFTVVFYSYRWLLGMGSAQTTVYESDAPAALRMAKDVVWFALLMLPFFLVPKAALAAWDNLKKHFTFAVLWAAFLVWFQVTGLIHLLYLQSASDTVLFWYRYPLEYMPMAVLLPAFAVDFRRLAKVTLWLCWFVVGFLAVEIASGRTGFGWGGLWTRYGSAFGSPNDLGIFCAICLIGLLLCAQNRWHYLLAACLGIGLLASQSRSALVGCLAGMAAVSYRKAPRRVLIGCVLVGAGALAYLAKFQPQLLDLATHLSASDTSALMRLEEWTRFVSEYRDPSLMSALFGTEYFHVESWYMALILRTGFIGLALFLLLIGASIYRCWTLRDDVLHALALEAIVVIAVGSVFIPYPDVFPTNFYLWFAVGIAWLPRYSPVQQDAPAGAGNESPVNGASPARPMTGT